jgi:hypothetical protein
MAEPVWVVRPWWRRQQLWTLAKLGWSGKISIVQEKEETTAPVGWLLLLLQGVSCSFFKAAVKVCLANLPMSVAV